MVILNLSKLVWQRDQRSNLTPHFQRRENYPGNEIWYLSAPSSLCDIQIWLSACIWSFQFTSWSLIEDAYWRRRECSYWVSATIFLILHYRASSQLVAKFFKAGTGFSSLYSEAQSSEVHIPSITGQDLSTGEPDHLPSLLWSKTQVNRCERSAFEALLCY